MSKNNNHEKWALLFPNEFKDQAYRLADKNGVVGLRAQTTWIRERMMSSVTQED